VTRTHRDIAALQARLDALPLTRLHVVAMLGCGLGFGFDIFEIAMGSALAAVFSSSSDPMHTFGLVWLLSSVYIGAVFGAPLLGWIAERHGRKRLLSIALLLLALTSTAAAFSRDALWLTVARGLSGLALGAFPPLMFAYLTDILPARRRGTCLMLVVALASLGAPLGLLLLRAAQASQPFGIDAWRLALLCGGTGAAITALFVHRLFESPRWLWLRGRDREAEAIVNALAASPVVARAAASSPAAAGGVDSAAARAATTLEPVSRPLGPAGLARLALVYVLSPWSTVVFPLLIGAALVERGLGLQQSLLFVAVSSFGPALGALLAAPILDRLERRTVLCVAGLAMVLCCVWFSRSVSQAAVLSSTLSFTFAASIYIAALSIYGSELFPTAQRAVMTSSAWAFNRVGAAFGPIVLVPLLRGQGEASMLLVIGAALVLSVALLLTLPAGFAGRPVR
jgi:MFS transporter, putative metabolite:H+ symporter